MDAPWCPNLKCSASVVEGQIEFLYPIFMGESHIIEFRHRRFPLTREFLLTLLMLSLFSACSLVSDHLTPTPTADEYLASFFETWNEAVESGNIDDTLAYFAEDARLETVGYYHLVSNGRDEIRTALEHWIGSGYIHMIGDYVFSSDDEALYWDLESGEKTFFCHGKVIVRNHQIIYLGYSTCK
jgi:hypothetical protein